jgi:hypothetical protein
MGAVLGDAHPPVGGYDGLLQSRSLQVAPGNIVELYFGQSQRGDIAALRVRCEVQVEDRQRAGA